MREPIRMLPKIHIQETCRPWSSQTLILLFSRVIKMISHLIIDLGSPKKSPHDLGKPQGKLSIIWMGWFKENCLNFEKWNKSTHFFFHSSWFFSEFPWWFSGKQFHPAMQEMQVGSLDRKDPLEKEILTHSSILAWDIPWTEEPGRLQSKGSQKSWTPQVSD